VIKVVYKWLKTTCLSIESEDAKLVEQVVMIAGELVVLRPIFVTILQCSSACA